MKLISLNLEGKKHLNKALPFIESERPDCIALMEVTEDTQDWLREQDYHTTFSPMTLKFHDGIQLSTGVMFASLEPHLASAHYYYHPNNVGMVPFVEDDKRNTIAHTVIYASVRNINIATTHFTWNANGEIADPDQKTDLRSLLSYLKTQSPHILCGDLNIPRYQNSLYEELTKYYTDDIPLEYKSSLDKKYHRHGENPKLQKLFDGFMVDYIFTQPPYKTSDTRLEFGISDHAAVITTIS